MGEKFGFWEVSFKNPHEVISKTTNYQVMIVLTSKHVPVTKKIGAKLKKGRKMIELAKVVDSAFLSSKIVFSCGNFRYQTL